jgi:Na+-transporting methylmalonyl-CoA/oxaloacetate decarboxylase gamma subunit
MSDFKVVVTFLGIVAIVLLVLLAVCRFMGMWTWTTAWILSSREEKVGLTRAMGHYNANGYLVSREHTADCATRSCPVHMLSRTKLGRVLLPGI